MNDVLPDQTPHWQYLEQVLRDLMAAYAYREIRFPVLEQTQLFKRSIGEATDIVEKEMYTFEDRNGDSLSLRPEGTASCVRAAEQHGLLYNQVQKLWYLGPMYRHERPQKGRYRQFYQLGVEAFGMNGSAIEAEILMLGVELWRRLGIADEIMLEINNLGASENRAAYGKALQQYLERYRDDLDVDSRRRLDSNVLRILDSKHRRTQEILQDAPKLRDYIDADSHGEFEQLLDLLHQAGIGYQVNPALVRGLDYYNGPVFEWTTEHLGAQATVCAGGRYDGLVKQLGGRDTPAIGFAMGMERILLMLESLDRLPAGLERQADVFIAVVGDAHSGPALLLADRIRRQRPGLRVLTHCGGGKYNSQLKKAYATGAHCAVVFEGSDDSLAEVKLRKLDDSGLSETVAIDAVPEKLGGYLSCPDA